MPKCGVLRTENPKNGLAAIGAFFKQKQVKRTDRGSYDYVFEHGQLWILHLPTGAIWSVVDAEGGPSVNGFDFEVIEHGEEL
jgi:hypothetical protein